MIRKPCQRDAGNQRNRQKPGEYPAADPTTRHEFFDRKHCQRFNSTVDANDTVTTDFLIRRICCNSWFRFSLFSPGAPICRLIACKARLEKNPIRFWNAKSDTARDESAFEKSRQCQAGRPRGFFR